MAYLVLRTLMSASRAPASAGDRFSINRDSPAWGRLMCDASHRRAPEKRLCSLAPCGG